MDDEYEKKEDHVDEDSSIDDNSYRFNEEVNEISNDSHQSNENDRDTTSDNNILSSLRNLLASEDIFDIINAQPNLSKGEIILLILKFSLEHNLSQLAISHLCQLINSLFIKDILPKTRYLIDKLFNESSNIQFHALCNICSSYLGIFERHPSNSQIIICKICGTHIPVHNPNYTDFFVTLNPSNGIKLLLESNENYYNYIVNERMYEKGIYKDIYDGKNYRNLIKSLQNDLEHSYATVTFNSDGSPVFESSSYSIWPIQIMVNELPFEIRTKKLIIYGLWFGRKKPNMIIFLQPFVDDMNVLSKSGIVCNILGMRKCIKIYCTICCVDSVARAPMQGLTQFNGHFGCNWCLHPGQWVIGSKDNNKKIIDNDNKKSGSMKYPLLSEIPKTRVEQHFLKHMQESFNIGKAVYGVKDTTPLINLEKFDMISGFVPDSLHCIFLGIGKQFTEIFMKLLPPWKVDEIDQVLTNFKYPHSLAHLSRSLKERKYWKSKDWENWILYSSVPVLQLVLEKKHLLHWVNFVEGVYLLSQTSILKSEIKKADYLLKQFVADAELLYSKSVMTYNVHQLVHISQSVINWGPLWSHSGYAFESGNGEIVTFIQAAKGVLNQITRCIAFRQNETYLKANVFEKSKKILELYDCLSSKHVKRTVKLSSIRYYGVPVHLSSDSKWKDKLNLSCDAVMYKRMSKDMCLYSSSTKINRRSNNNFAITNDNLFIQIEYFLLDDYTKNEYTICRPVTVENALQNKYIFLKKIIRINTNLIAIKTKNIAKICVFLEICNNGQQYLCITPNVFIS